MDKLRLRFSKTGRAVYISHLDLMRTMQRSFLRAGYQLKYSDGFNPHPQISIALPLSVGAGSLCELMDFRMEGEPDLAAMPERLTAMMPEGIRALEAYEAERKPSQIKWLRVEGVFEYDARDAALMAAAAVRMERKKATATELTRSAELRYGSWNRASLGMTLFARKAEEFQRQIALDASV